MGNCQAVDAAALVIQHPNGKVERMYWPISASDVMKMHPGHHVSLIIPLPLSSPDKASSESGSDKRTVRFTRVKLLRPTDTLVLGRAYRLVTSQEVMKVLRAKKYAKIKKEAQSMEGNQENPGAGSKEQAQLSDADNSQVMKHERQRLRAVSTSSRSKTWRPSLQSISEGEFKAI